MVFFPLLDDSSRSPLPKLRRDPFQDASWHRQNRVGRHPDGRNSGRLLCSQTA